MTQSSVAPPAAGTSRRRFRESVTADLAAGQDGVCHRAQLRALGVTRDDVRYEVAAGRWTTWGKHTVQLRPGGGDRAEWRRAVWETRGVAWVDGITALIAAGLTGWEERVVHVSVPAGAGIVPVDGVRIHHLRSRSYQCTGDPPRAEVDRAALNAASWASSDRAATTILAMVVQQRLTTGDRLAESLRSAPAVHRVGVIRQTVADVRGGAQALSEIDFGRLCRRYGVPEPSRQAVRPGPTGRIYLDASWDEYDLAVEVDGFQHAHGLAMINDVLRDNAMALAGTSTLRIPVLGLRTSPDAFMAQLIEALRRRGWSP